MRWYYYLNRKDEKSLLSFEKVEKDNLVIGVWTKTKKYTIFDNYILFFDFQDSLPIKERCFFEILLPDSKRKPYFDIDVDGENKDNFIEDGFVRDLKTVILKLIPSAIILVFTSHTEKKKSFHVIIDGFYLGGNKECKMFFEKVHSLVSDEYEDYYDESVYKTTQQFRILGSHKYEKNNFKVFREDLSHNFKYPERYKTERGKNLFLFFSSLVSKTERCQYLEGYQEEVEEKKKVIGTAKEEDLGEVIDLFKETKPYKRGNFEFKEVIESDGNLILIMNSSSGYYCDGCKRIHDAENPYLSVSGKERNVYFNCRRGSNQYLGKLGNSGEEEEIEVEKEEGKIEVPVVEGASKDSPERLDELMSIKRREKRKTKKELNFPLSFSVYGN
jgi:hypothetical protein